MSSRCVSEMVCALSEEGPCSWGGPLAAEERIHCGCWRQVAGRRGALKADRRLSVVSRVFDGFFLALYCIVVLSAVSDAHAIGIQDFRLGVGKFAAADISTVRGVDVCGGL